MISTNSSAQEIVPPAHDTSYFVTYPSSFVVRAFYSQKYASLLIKNDGNAPDLDYRSNGKPAIGVGVTYRTISVNIAYGMDLFNRQQERGETKKFDIQTRVYIRKWAVDLFGQFYKGYYLSPKGTAQQNKNSYYSRPDIKLNVAGISAYRIFNHKRFTLRPAFIQDETQIKSAGSFLGGGEVYYMKSHRNNRDSSLVPVELSSMYKFGDIHSVQIIRAGVGGGYAYTQVLPFHLYLTGSLTAGVNLSHVKESFRVNNNSTRLSVDPSLFYRAAAGYDNGKTIINVFWLNNALSARGHESGFKYTVNTGNFRVILARRLEPGPRGKKLLRYPDMFLVR